MPLSGLCRCWTGKKVSCSLWLANSLQTADAAGGIPPWPRSRPRSPGRRAQLAAGRAARPARLSPGCGPASANRSKALAARSSSCTQPSKRRPTMGGLFIVAGIAAQRSRPTGRTPLCWSAMLLMLALAAVGAVDDLAKLRTAAPGLSARDKLAGQVGHRHVAATRGLAPASANARRTRFAVCRWAEPAFTGRLVRAAGRVGAGRSFQRRQSGRWARRPGRRLSVLRDGRHGSAGLCQRACPMGSLSCKSPTCRRPASWWSWPAACSARCWASSGSTAFRPRCSWAIPARCRWADCWACWQSSAGRS